MSDNATIVACATGSPGVGAERALIRASGPACPALAAALLSRSPEGRSRLAARFRLTDSLELPCLAWAGVSPRTFTGEEALELLVPGNAHVVQRVIDRLCAAEPGVRRAEPGEFSAQAYLNGKLTLEQAEGVAAMVAAGKAEELEAAGAVLSGAAGREYRAFADEAAALLALVEAGIDFTDQEDVVAIEPRALMERTERLLRSIRARLGAASGREAASGLVRVALVGLPNAGKSTLFNALLGRERAVAAPIAGTTRDALAEPLTISLPGREPVVVELLDLPGLDRHAGGIDARAQASALGAIEASSVHIRCCEHGRFEGMPPLPREARTVLVRTKADRPGWVEGAEVAVCALTGAGLDALRRLIAGAAAGAAGDRSTGVVVARHAAALSDAAESLARIQRGAPAELNAHHLRSALDALGEITGAVPPDAVIGRIFASFCVGK